MLICDPCRSSADRHAAFRRRGVQGVPSAHHPDICENARHTASELHLHGYPCGCQHGLTHQSEPETREAKPA